MALDSIKYKSDTKRILGLAFFAPSGRFFFDVVYLGKYYDILTLAMLTTISLLLSVIGFSLIKEGYDILHKGDEK
ncbi:MAG: hypothetical protein A3B68_09130 [Candidatus Melainabacteria bacterium RIFCSPHIGHO2_02_FULL_34_12]|nr:MAG: hypothetical protein A3B68_09130 [Candidatus Melainabacteria bacterium RIFCSPHIGHO2_02_FULL_34_12]